jgi:transcriptional regulator with XRE-family HTH domain
VNRRTDRSSRSTLDERHRARAFGIAIQRLRLVWGWTQQRLADAAGVSQSTVSRIERGLAPRATLATIGRLLEALSDCRELVLRLTF